MLSTCCPTIEFRLHRSYSQGKSSKNPVVFNLSESKQVAFEFVVFKESFSFSKDNVVMLKLVDDLNVTINCDQPAYYNETVNMSLNIEK